MPHTDPVAPGAVALMPRSSKLGNLPSHWATYFTVINPDEAARSAVSLGGQVHVPPQDIPDVGRSRGITSPQGVKFCAIKYVSRA